MEYPFNTGVTENPNPPVRMIPEPFSIRLPGGEKAIPTPVAVGFTISEVVTPETDSNKKTDTRIIGFYTSHFLAIRWLRHHAEKDKLYRITSYRGWEAP